MTLLEKIDKFPPPPDMEGKPDHEIRLRLWRSFGGPEPVRPWPGPVSDLYYGWIGLGRDMNGTTLTGERRSWVEQRSNGWSHDEGEVEAAMYLFMVLESEMGRIHNELYPPPKQGK